jgi:hypothetical protein
MNSRAWMIVTLCGVLGALTACSSDSGFVKPGYDFRSVGKVAALVTMNAGNPAQRQEVADLFAIHVLQKGYDVVDRAPLADLGNEAAFQDASGITSPEGRKKLATHKLSVVIVANVHMPTHESWRAKYGYTDETAEDITMTAQMFDVEAGTLLWAGHGRITLDIVLEDYGIALPKAGAATRSAAEKALVPVIGGIAGAQAGGTVGAALEPDITRLLHSLIERTCKDLPPRTQAGAVPSPR